MGLKPFWLKLDVELRHLSPTSLTMGATRALITVKIAETTVYFNDNKVASAFGEAIAQAIIAQVGSVKYPPQTAGNLANGHDTSSDAEAQIEDRLDCVRPALASLINGLPCKPIDK